MPQRIWLITGISRGFGKALTAAALARGDRVIGTTRDGRAPLESGALTVLALDLTDPTAIAPAVSHAVSVAGRLDVIVNNAGYALVGAFEEASDEDVARLFEVNFHAPRRLIRAALPTLRRQKSGHIINISSIAGLAPSPGSSFYAASKFALEGLSQSLAQELAPLGIRLTLVEPGFFRTDFLSDHSLRSREVGLSEYASTAGAALARMRGAQGRQPGDPARAAAAILQVVNAPEPPLHLVLGPDAYARTRTKQEQLAADLERWKATTLSTDFV